MKEAGIWAPGELDMLLRKYGGSLAQEKRYYAEYNIGRAIVYQSVNTQPNVTHDEMLAYYRTHEKDYFVPERTRFEIMSVKFANFPDKERASEAICAMGNEVFYGASFAAVAKKSHRASMPSEEATTIGPPGATWPPSGSMMPCSRWSPAS